MTFLINILPRTVKGLVPWTGGQASPLVSTEEPAAGMRLSRHDHHNLEIKAWVEPGRLHSQTQIEFFLFVPRSFQMDRWQKHELEKDLLSRIRLAMPVLGEGLSREIPAAVLLERALRLLRDQDFQTVGSLVSEWLKQRAVEHRRRFQMAHSLFIPVEQRGLEIRRLLVEIAQTVEALHALRSAYPAEEDRGRRWLDEYTSNFYVQYLGKLRAAMEKVDPLAREKADSEKYRAAWKEFEASLAAFSRAEATYRARFPKRVESATTEFESEQALLRLGQLKKFFQSRTFLEVSRHSPASRFLETTAILGTAVAGLCWAGLQLLSQPSASTAGSGAFFLGFAVLAYVARDRIKDRAKHSLHKRVQRWLPDSNQQLRAGGRFVGAMREWFSIHASTALREEIRELRAQADSELLPSLPEDVLYIRRRLDLVSNAGAETGWAFQENTRVNLERYLKYMDDPVKQLSMIDSDGAWVKRNTRRVYHFYVATQLTTTLPLPGAPARSWRQLHRVVLDKQGIDRVEPCHSEALSS